jgi:hypothetical protein
VLRGGLRLYRSKMANAPLVSADDDTIIEIVKDAINSGRRATLQLSSAQSIAVRSWLLTPEGDAVVKRLRRRSGLATIVRCAD